MKVLKVIKKTLVGTLITVFFIFAIIVTLLLLSFNKYAVSQFGNTSLIIIREEMSSSDYQKGDLVFVEKQRVPNINVGDEIFVYKINSDRTVNVNVGTVGEVHLNDDSISFEVGATYSDEFIIGKATKVYSKIGKILSIVQSKWGFLFLILVPNFLIFVYELYALVTEIKYGKEEQ